MRHLETEADRAGFLLLAPDSRDHTWDAVTEEFGPDVTFIDQALSAAFSRCAVDPRRIAVAGFSDGATYALALARTNGDLFSRGIAFSPGFLVPVTPHKLPRLFVSHGTADQILPIDRCGRPVVAGLRQAGYRVRYREFDGGHEVPPAIAADAVRWFLHTTV
ncbi:MAG: phospholipase [Gemmatimonadales bacterium]